MTANFQIPDRQVFVSNAQNKLFIEQGYFIVRNFITPDSCDDLTRWYDDNPPELNSGFHTSIHSKDATLRRAVTQQVRKHFDEPLEQRLNGYRPVFSAFTVKEPDTKSGFDLHLDWSMVDERKYTSLTCWVPLIDITDDNGFLWILHGSHRFHRTIRGGPGLKLWCEVPPAQWKDCFELRKLKLRKGDALIYDHRLFHGSPPNNSQNRRLAINHTVIPVEARSLHYQFPDRNRVEAIEVPDDFYHTHILNTPPASGSSAWSEQISGAFIFQHAVNKLMDGKGVSRAS